MELAFYTTSDIRLETGYDGRLLTFENTNRLFNGGSVAVMF